MDTFAAYLETLENPDRRARMEEVLAWVKNEFPQLEPIVKWNQPMYSDHGTFIVGFSAAKGHMAVSPEVAAMKRFSDAIEKDGYSQTAGLFRIRWDQPVDWELLRAMIAFNIEDKRGHQKFWR